MNEVNLQIAYAKRSVAELEISYTLVVITRKPKKRNKMEKKEKILEKLNMKDYTNRLEKILEKKKFSLDTKNLLLSMLYKIENGYNDYEKTKVQAPSKSEFIESIFQKIQKNCKEIIVAEFNSEVSKVLKERNVQYIIDKEEGKIIAIGNELLVLNCILEMSQKQVCIPQEQQNMQVAISNLLNIGNQMNQAEVIRDFNGWSWDIVLKEVTNIEINLIFQTLLYLVGYEFLQNWINNNTNLADYLALLYAHMKENFGEKRAEQFTVLIYKLAIDIVISENKEQYQFWKEERDSLQTELEKLQDKTKYLEAKTKEKKEYSKQIEKIDRILNNKELLQKEYETRNSKLANKEKIFSISHLAKRLEQEREDLLEQMKQCNRLIEPKGYVTRKREVERKVQFLNRLDIEQEEDKRKNLIELCSIYLECFQIKVAKAQTKQKMIEYIYELRYYGFLPLDVEGMKLKELPKLKHLFEQSKKELLEKARKLNVIEQITEDIIVNEKILGNIFDSKMIDLDHMVIETKVVEGKLYVEYYDEKVLENTVEVQSDKTVRLKKKTKLFV